MMIFDFLEITEVQKFTKHVDYVRNLFLNVSSQPRTSSVKTCILKNIVF